MSRLRFLLSATVVLALAAPATADFIAYDHPTNDAGNQTFTGSLGLEFHVVQPITITAFGIFAPANATGQTAIPTIPVSPSNTAINVKLWDAAALPNPTVVDNLTVTFTNANPGTAFHQNLFLTLATPISLPAGFDGVIAADGYNVDFQNGNTTVFTSPFTSPTEDDGGGLITFSTSSLFGGAGIFPTTSQPNNIAPDAPVWGGPTFEFISTADVPEPSSLLLLGLTSAATAGYARRRRKKADQSAAA